MAASKSSAEQLITDNIDVWTSAIKKRGSQGRGSSKKVELYGIKKLRELILELAVRGLLVPQDPSDEPASVLLEKIAVKKEKLIKDGKVKKQKPLPEITEEEKPFDLPSGWRWTRLGNIGLTQTGSTPKKSDAHLYGEGTPFIKPGDISEGRINSYENDSLTAEGAASLGRLAPSGSVLMVCIGTIGKCARVDRNVAFNQQINSVTPYLSIGRFIEKVLQSSFFQKLAWDSSSSTTLSILNKGKWELIPVAISPEAEQPRIVAKVNELMALCDQLEQQTETSLTAHKTLVETLLNTLLTAAQTTPANSSQESSSLTNSFDQAWNRIAQHFDVLFTTEHSIDQLKQTILQLAVMGKLVPQDPNDEPASVLLEKIAAEKEQLIKDKKIKKQKALPPIGEDEKPFELPRGWEWCRYFDVNTVRSELVPASDFPDENQIAPDSIEKGTGILIDHRSVAEAGAKGPNNRFYTGQILYSKIRPSLNKVVIAPYDGLCSADMYPIYCHTDSMFMMKYMLSEAFLIQVRKAENRVKMPKLNLESLGMFLTVLPPEAEQSRISRRVNEFMELCEALKTNIRKSLATQNLLADAMAEKALN